MEEMVEHWYSSRVQNKMFIKALPDWDVDIVNCFFYPLMVQRVWWERKLKRASLYRDIPLVSIEKGGKVLPCIRKMGRTIILTDVAFFIWIRIQILIK